MRLLMLDISSVLTADLSFFFLPPYLAMKSRVIVHILHVPSFFIEIKRSFPLVLTVTVG